MRKLLWIGDATVASGFARITHHVLDVLRESWEVSVLGLNYIGDPHPLPYDVYPCWPGGDAFGLGRVKKLVKAIGPDLIVVQNDPWNLPEYLEQIEDAAPVVGALAVDGKNCRAADYGLNRLALAIFWTRFGLEQARDGGLEVPGTTIPLGVDLELYKPLDRSEARLTVGFPPHMMDGFIVGNVNRNQPRKRLDLTVEAFARWVRDYKIDNAFLFLQVCPTGDVGYDVKQLKRYFDPEGRSWMIVSEPPMGHGIPEELMASVYSCMDVQLTTTQGEGWGLTTMEGMACGVPQIVPDWSALGEWTEDAAIGVSCPTTAVTPNRSNVVGGVPDVKEVGKALQHLYSIRERREELRAKGLALVARPEYRWRAIGLRYAEALEQVMRMPRVERVEEGKEAVA